MLPFSTDSFTSIDINEHPEHYEMAASNSDEYGPILQMVHNPLFWISISHLYKFRRCYEK